MLYREPKVLKRLLLLIQCHAHAVSVLYREPKVLKRDVLQLMRDCHTCVSVLYREPKVLKRDQFTLCVDDVRAFQCSTVSRKY